MNKIIRQSLCIVVVSTIFGLTSFGQLNNTAFIDQPNSYEEKEEKLFLGITTTNFLKNNEYFNKIVDGYTLFGYQLNPYLSYYPSENVSINAGVFLKKNFGQQKFSTIAPTFNIEINKNDFSLIFGNVKGSLNHLLIEPVYDFERVIFHPLEYGLQGVLNKERTFLDLWVNWETFIERGDPFQEELSGGISFSYKLISNENFNLFVPAQFLIYHKGGQIDTSPEPLITRFNHAIGVGFESTESEPSFLKGVRSELYFLSYRDISNAIQAVFEEGNGWFLNFIVKTKIGDMGLSYWYGDQYIPVKGGLLYSSVSSTIEYSGYNEKIRKLLIFRFSKDYEIIDGLTLTGRLEPFYDMQNKKTDYSFGFYMNYTGFFYLLKNGSDE